MHNCAQTSARKSWSQKGHSQGPAVLCGRFQVVGCGQWVLRESSMCSEGKSVIGVIFHVTLTLGVRSRLLLSM